MSAPPLYAAVEGGGTKFVCAVGHGPDTVLRKVRIATRGPDATLADVAAFLAAARDEFGPFAGLGIACFGPMRLDPAAPDFARLLAESKPGWNGADLVGPLVAVTDCPVAIETDVNAAAVAEAGLGAGVGADPVAYITVGTGIGIGIVVGGKPLHGLLHPEGGHMRVRRHPADIGFSGVCVYHGDCAEGVACGPAIAARSGVRAEDLPPDHPDWEIVAATLGEVCATLVFALSPQRIVLGGGVMTSGDLLPRVRELTGEVLAGFIEPLTTAKGLERLIVAPQCDVPGLAGAFLLAQSAAG